MKPRIKHDTRFSNHERTCTKCRRSFTTRYLVKLCPRCYHAMKRRQAQANARAAT